VDAGSESSRKKPSTFRITERPRLNAYSTRLMRLQIDLIQALDKHRRGQKQTVQARDVHIHSGAHGVVGVINSGKDGRDGGERDGSPALKVPTIL
jgi:hypothetical protein